MTLLEAALLGVVEGLTEFLPVSSTGHLIVVGHWLGAHDAPAERAFADAFDVVIQAGALGAVLFHYRALLASHARGFARGEPASRTLVAALGLAAAPALALGFALRKLIERHLFGPRPVAVALIAGGVAMIVIERLLARREKAVARESAGALPTAASEGLSSPARLGELTLRRAVTIGLAQCAALWPGTSRSMSTILGARLVGLDATAAAEFSFLLAIPTLGAVTVYKCVKARHVLFAGDGALALGVGTVAAFLVAWGVIAVFLRAIRRWGLAPFGYYRVILGALVLMTANAARSV